MINTINENSTSQFGKKKYRKRFSIYQTKQYDVMVDYEIWGQDPQLHYIKAVYLNPFCASVSSSENADNTSNLPCRVVRIQFIDACKMLNEF